MIMEPKSDSCAGIDEYDSSDDDYDPKYQLFMKNVKTSGKSYVLEVSEQNGFSRVWRYEKDDDLDGGWDSEKCDTQVDSDVKKRKKRLIKPRAITKRKKELIEDARKKEVTGDARKKELNVDVKNMIEEDYKCVLDCDLISSYDVADEDYLSLLVGHQESEKGNIEFYFEGHWVEYEADLESEVSVIDPKTFEIEGVSNPFVLSKFNETLNEDKSQLLGGPGGSSQSQFRENLVRVLRRPYDQREYKRLRDDIGDRKPMGYNRDLRNGRDMMYLSNKKGKSYLDHYSDFKREFRAAKKDRHKKLNLLRGFFFYLQNLTQEGSFRPWKDQSCLEVMPSSP